MSSAATWRRRASISPMSSKVVSATWSIMAKAMSFFMIGGKVELSIASSQLLLDALPPLIHVRGTSSQAQALRWLLDQLVRERQGAFPGAHIASNQLAHLMFIQILRAHFETAGLQPAGWLRALSDRRLAPALQLMHDEPAAPGNFENSHKQRRCHVRRLPLTSRRLLECRRFRI